MAREFDAAASDFLRGASTPVTDYPFTMSCWFNVNDVTNAYALMGIYDAGSANDRWYLESAGSIANDPFRATTKRAATSSSVVNGVTAGVWHHGAGVYESTTRRTAYFNGTAGVDDVGLQPVVNVDRVSIGVIDSSSQIQFLDGRVAEAAVWNVALTADEITILSRGYSPLLVRPESLVVYTPLIGRYSPEPDIVGGVNQTVTGAIYAEHPRIIYPPRRKLYIPSAAAAGGTTFPVSLSASIARRATVQRAGRLILPASVARTGTIKRQASMARPANVSRQATVQRETALTRAVSVARTVAVSLAFVIPIALSAVIARAAQVVRQGRLTKAANVARTAAMSRATSLFLAATVARTAAVVRAASLAFSAVVSRTASVLAESVVIATAVALAVSRGFEVAVQIVVERRRVFRGGVGLGLIMRQKKRWRSRGRVGTKSESRGWQSRSKVNWKPDKE